MTWEFFWNAFYDLVLMTGLPLVYVYHLICGDPFLNSSAEDAQGLEMTANVLLAPAQYVLVGENAHPRADGTYQFTTLYNYRDAMLLPKTMAAWAVAPAAVPFGVACKALACLDPSVRQRQEALYRSKNEPYAVSNIGHYRDMGMETNHIAEAEELKIEKYHPRRPGDENHLLHEKEALKEIVALFDEHKIPYWLDCGSCLGAYRYGGIIPWDNDIDIAILQPDFDNAFSVLKQLDPERFVVLDWSARVRPKTYMLVYIKATGTVMDLYTYEVDPADKQLTFVVSNIESMYLPQSWKTRESRYTAPVPFDMIFPLKKAQFDGQIVAVPNKTKEYLQVRYGENIDPVRIYDEKTGTYERDLSHPYWSLEGNNH